MRLGPPAAPLEVSMSLSFFFDMPSAHFNCLSKAFAERPLGIFWGVTNQPKGISHLYIYPRV